MIDATITTVTTVAPGIHICEAGWLKTYQVKHAAQHGQKQESCFGAHIVKGAHHCSAGGWDAKYKRPDRVQVKLRLEDGYNSNYLILIIKFFITQNVLDGIHFLLNVNQFILKVSDAFE